MKELMRSLRGRVLLSSLLVCALTFAVTGALLIHLIRGEFERRFDAELSAHLDQLLARVGQDSTGSLVVVGALSDPRFQRPYSRFYWQVEDQTGNRIRSRSLWDAVLPLPVDAPADGEIHRHRLPGPDGQRLVAIERRVTLPGYPQVVRAAVAADVVSLEDSIDSISYILIATFAVLAIGLSFIVAGQVWMVFRPLARLRAQVMAIRSGKSGRIDGAFPSEVTPLVEDLNAVLAHSREVVTRGRVQAGNLAHGLKTPLAILANAVAALDAGEASEMIRAQAVAIRRQLDHALSRTRAAAAAGVPGVRCDVADRVSNVVRAMETLYRERNLDFDVTLVTPVEVAIEIQDLDEMLGNLLDNACRFANTRVAVTATLDEPGCKITVEDDGRGIAPAMAQEIVEGGLPLDRSSGGAGLGLGIVRDLARAYKGELRLGHSGLGGLAATLVLPIASRAVGAPEDLATVMRCL
ncbi:ATP-binding protein (plasmid) [Methylocella tundrae]|uniref:histidine kinase n=2 Tax=Methylocella tundrae TaxID=227605 RepID=A0A4U8Z6G5_METTU|nr:ATP-binding protein [Methylocella tundrae]VFU16307.1 ATP-binding protein [Methylocella tundrae]